MEKRVLGKTGMHVSALGFGGAEIGLQGISAQTVTELLNGALDAGLNVIDTAECYGDSEEMIGTAVSHRRKDVYLFTKCGHGETYYEPRWRYDEILACIERSLKRLQTDYLDLVQLHSCSLETLGREEAIRALQKAKQDGKTRFIGYSGDGEAAKYAIECGVFDTLQTSISIADQEAIDLTLPLARDRGMGVIAKRPIANAAWRTGSRPENEYVQPYWERLQELKYDFIDGDPERSVEIALRFTLSVPGVHTAIVGTTKPGRWLENARLVEKGPLPPEQYEAIRKRWQQVSGPAWEGQG
ncbi:MAG TPA: aldo/keto reductase [Candidatus Obscuribacterales bacterium]